MPTEPIGLYIHVPFCTRRCGYCDFVVRVGQEKYWDRYVDVLRLELEAWSTPVGHQALHSVYFGGGTPSLIGAKRIEAVLETVRSCYTLQADPEITVEANPETLSEKLLDDLRRSGVNRLSLGVQSFNPLLLERLDRSHRADSVTQGVAWARQAGIENLSLDLIYGIPQQTLEDWRTDLEKAVSLAPEHLSTYELTLEPGTPMGRRVARGDERLPLEQVVIAMYEWTQSYLAAQGYQQYEISNFAKPGRECIHNLNTWQCGEYLGVGLAAHSHFSGRRFCRTRSLGTYLSGTLDGDKPLGNRAPSIPRSPAPDGLRWSEALILGLRLNRGVVLSELTQRLGSRPPEAMRNCLEEYARQGLLERAGDHFRFTPRGRLLSNCLFAELVV